MRHEKIQSLEELLGNVSRETVDRLERFETRLRAWNQRINVVSRSDLDLLWSRHILDSAQLILHAPAGAVWLDIGSGGGFPGLVIACLLEQFGGGHIHLVESNRKKAAFLLSIVSEIGAPATVHPRRIEQMHGKLLDVNVVTARAVAPLTRLLGLAEPWLSDSAHSLFLKGKDYPVELQESHNEWSFALVKHLSRTDSEAVILEISELRRRM